MKMQPLSLREHDIVSSIEAAYAIEADDKTWMRGLLASIRPAVDQGGGVMGYFYDATSGEKVRISGHTAMGVQAKVLSTLMPILTGLAPGDFKRMHLDCPRVMASASEVLSHERVREYTKVWLARTAPIIETVGIKCHEPEGWGAMLGFCVPHPTSVDSQTESAWSRLAAHVTSALRIRRRLRIAGQSAENDAVLNASGKVEHAETPAKEASVREMLSRAVRSREMARGPMRRTQPDEAADLWEALVDGRWSLLDQLDADGRRWVLARRNAPASVEGPELTARERQVLAYVALGQSNKLVGYTLGITSAAVGNLVARAAQKLGVSSRVELVERLCQIPLERNATS